MGKIDGPTDSSGFSAPQKDEFQPKYQLEYGLPEVPVKPKLFRHVDTNIESEANIMHKYEYSSIEMIQEQNMTNQIYTDYNLGMRVNLVDRSIYKLPDDSEVSAEALKAKMSEKLKYILSDKDTYDPFEGQQKLKMSKKIIIPSNFIAHDKIHRYGGRIADPFELNTQNPHEADDRVFTSVEHQKLSEKRRKGAE